MGCQASKLEQENGEMQLNIPPYFSRKLEEIRKHKAGATTLSKNELLKDGYENDCGSPHTNDRKSTVSSPEPDEDSTRSAKVASEPTEPEEIFSDKEVIIAEEKDNKGNDNGDEKEKVIEALTTTIEGLAMEETEDEQEFEEHRLASPGSPSFRLYLNDSLHNKDDDHGKSDYMNKGSLSDTDVDAAEIVKSRIPNEELVTKIKNRSGRKAMKIRRVIPRGKRNFLNVKACYYPSCGCGGHEISRHRLINAKSSTR